MEPTQPAFTIPSQTDQRIATAQKVKFYINDFFSKCDKIRRKLRLWSHLLKKFYWAISVFVQCDPLPDNWNRGGPVHQMR